jgi:hypothetical protein
MKTKAKVYGSDESHDIVGHMMDYESGRLPQAQSIELFQRLINTGMAWQLQGHYGRTATMLLDKGLCVVAAARRERRDGYH